MTFSRRWPGQQELDFSDEQKSDRDRRDHEGVERVGEDDAEIDTGAQADRQERQATFLKRAICDELRRSGAQRVRI